MFRDPIAFGLQSERAKQQDTAIAAATAEVADVADDEELASYAGLVGKRIYDADDDVAAEIVSIDTASSRGQKYEEIRATCVELIDYTVPDCALTLTGKVSPLCHTCMSFSHSHSHSHSHSTCIFYFLICLPTPTSAPPIAAQVKTKCNVCGRNHEIDYGISSTDPAVKYQPIEELVSAYEELDC